MDRLGMCMDELRVLARSNDPDRAVDFAAHIRCRAHDDYGLDVVIAQNGVEVRLKECVILMLYDAVLTLFWGKHLVIKLEKHLFSWLGSGAKFQRYGAVRRH